MCAFAARDIERGQVVVEYEGELIAAEEARDRKMIQGRVANVYSDVLRV